MSLCDRVTAVLDYGKQIEELPADINEKMKK
jgi:hypothetical protein